MLTCLAAVIRHAMRMPTNRMIKPITPCIGLESPRNGDTSPISASVPTAFATLGLGASLEDSLDLALRLRAPVLHVLRQRHGDSRQGHGGVGQQHCRDLVAAPADAS